MIRRIVVDNGMFAQKCSNEYPLQEQCMRAYQTQPFNYRIDKKIIKSIIVPDESFYQLPIFGTKAPAGFPSPADDYLEDKLSCELHQLGRPGPFLQNLAPHTGIRYKFGHKI